MDSQTLNSFTKNIRVRFRELIFRRTKNVNPGTLIDTYLVEPLMMPPWETRRPISDAEFSVLAENVKERRVQREYDSYLGYTDGRALRSNDPYNGMDVEFTYETNTQFNLLNLSFDEDSASQVPPEAPIYDRDGKISEVGDLICGWVDPGKNGKCPEYVNWFVCSEQFFRAWTLVMYGDHETFRKIYGKPEQMRKRMLSGNRLNTNSYLKWLLGCLQSGVKVTEQELLDHFYIQRTEYISKYTVHTYTSLSLLVRYGELPQESNIPNNADNSHKMKKWSLFPGLLEDLTFKLTQKRIELEVALCKPFEVPVIQEPPSVSHGENESSTLLERLQSLEKTLQTQLNIQHMQQCIWQQEWQFQQQRWRIQQCEWAWRERENSMRWEMQHREEIRQKWEMQEEHEMQMKQQSDQMVQGLDEILQEGKEEDILQEQLMQMRLQQQEKQEQEKQEQEKQEQEKQEQEKQEQEKQEQEKQEQLMQMRLQQQEKQQQEKQEQEKQEQEKQEQEKQEQEKQEQEKQEQQKEKRKRKTSSERRRIKRNKEKEVKEKELEKEVEEKEAKEKEAKEFWKEFEISGSWADYCEKEDQMDYNAPPLVF